MTPDEITAELAKCEAVDPWDIGAWPDSAREHYAAALRELQSLQQRLAEAERERDEARLEAKLWKPLTPEEADAEIDAIAAEPLTFEQEQKIDAMVEEITKNGPDPAWRAPEPWYVEMAGYCKRLKSWLDAIRVECANEGKGSLEHLLATTALCRATTLIGVSRLKKLQEAEQRLAEQAGWLPIESAPKDGLFLVATDDARVDVVKPHFCNGWVYSATDRSELIMGPIRPNSTPSQSGPMPYKITHWRPLPAPPEAKGG